MSFAGIAFALYGTDGMLLTFAPAIFGPRQIELGAERNGNHDQCI